LEVDAAARLVSRMLHDPVWRNKLRNSIERAMVHLLGIRGHKYNVARGRLFELRMLLRALDKWERSEWRQSMNS
jgi:hypothetical protein